MFCPVFERYPDDAYDRIWTPYNSNDWKQINTSLPVDQASSSSSYSFITLPPSTVMRTAATPSNDSNNMEFHFMPSYDNASIYYAYMYFAEIQKLQENQIREFNIFLNGSPFNANPIRPSYLETLYYLAAMNGPLLQVWINKTDTSNLPPLFNAIEIYKPKDFSQSQTQQTDGMCIACNLC